MNIFFLVSNINRFIYNLIRYVKLLPANQLVVSQSLPPPTIEPFQKLPTPPHGPRLLGPYGPRILREAFMASAMRAVWEVFPETDYA